MMVKPRASPLSNSSRVPFFMSRGECGRKGQRKSVLSVKPSRTFLSVMALPLLSSGVNRNSP